MNNLTQISDYNLSATPWFFGAHFNMAQFNVMEISNKINNKLHLDIPLLESENELAGNNSYLQNTDLIDKNKLLPIYSNVKKYLPFCQYFSSEDQAIKSGLKAEREGIDMVNMELFFQFSFHTLNALKLLYAHHYLYKETGKENLFSHTIFTHFIRNIYNFALYCAMQKHENLISKNRFLTVNEIMAKQLFNPDNTLSIHGMVFFCNLFLEKSNACNLFQKTYQSEIKNIQVFIALQKVFTVLCAKLPQPEILYTESRQAFQINLINYLQKAPLPLFKAIGKKYQKQFLPCISEANTQDIAAGQPNNTLAINDYDRYQANDFIHIRKTDRFAEFALYFLENTTNFNYYFQLYIGKSLVRSYKKSLLNERPDKINRFIYKNIKTFQLLSLFTQKKEKAIQKIIKTFSEEKRFKELFNGDNINYFEEYAPKYNINGNKIGILSKNNKDYDKMLYRPLLPDAFLSVHELPKITLLEILSEGKTSEIIDNFLQKSNNIILNKNFIDEVKIQCDFNPLKRMYLNDDFNFINYQKKPLFSQKNYNNQEIIKYINYIDEIKRRKRKLNDILSVYALNVKQIPERILDYWLNIISLSLDDHFANKIKAEKKDCVRRIKLIQKNKAPQLMAMINFLLKDINKLIIDIEVKNRITTFYFNVLKECLLFFSEAENRKLFVKICQFDLHLFDTQKGHPFLSKIDFLSIDKTSDLYKQYIELKGTHETYCYANNENQKVVKKPDNWLFNTFYKTRTNDTKKIVIKLPDDTSQIPLSYRHFIDKNTEIDCWLNKISNQKRQKPVDLPTNLFDEVLIELLKEKVKTIINPSLDYNYSKLLALWINETQDFYNAKRKYVIYKDKPYQCVVKFQPDHQKPFKDFYSYQLNNLYTIIKKSNRLIKKKQIDSVFKKAIDENEKMIRFYQTKDRISYLMLKRVMPDETTFSLQQITPQCEIGPLHTPVKISLFIHGKTIVDIRKRKDFQHFKNSLTDPRLKNLMAYYDNDVINFKELKYELTAYDVVKETIFQTVHVLEEFMRNKLNINITSIDDTDNLHAIYLKHLKSKKIISQKQCTFLMEIRNSFFQGSFPKKTSITPYLALDNRENIMAHIIEKYMDDIQTLIKQFS